jgi:hypothetical protein
VSDHPHIELLRRTYAAFTTGDMDALAEVRGGRRRLSRGRVAGTEAVSMGDDPVRVQLGPHARGAERFAAVCNGASFAHVAGVILHKQAQVQNPEKDEVPSSSPGGPLGQGGQLLLPLPTAA